MPVKPLFYSIAFCVFIALSTSVSAQTLKASVTDTSGKPLAFATIKIADTNEGMMADLNGSFTVKLNSHFSYITISHLGYKPQKVALNVRDTARVLHIILQPKPTSLDEVVVTNPANKIKRILRNAIANRNKNNPDKYDWYQCKVYYKMSLDLLPPNQVFQQDTSEQAREWQESMKQQHMFFTETYSRRTWERPQKLQEDVIASRVSGFKKAWFTSLVTDVLPFHAYTDFLSLNGKDYHNPLSTGFYQRFHFRIEDELLTGADTTWIISFKPKTDPENLSGTLYISSNGFALSHLIAQNYDSSLKRTAGIEQQYKLVQGKWFPDQLNYFINWKGLYGWKEVYMRGTSSIDSVSFARKKDFKFDKAHTVRLQPQADQLTNEQWEQIRPTSLSLKEERTYEFLDSIGKKFHFDKITLYMDRLSEGYFPAGYIDIDLKRLYNSNSYEKARLGAGFRTSKQLSKRFSVGGWFGYGLGDRDWKYGGFAEVYADQYREFTFSLNYQKDLQVPGALQIHEDLDNSFLRRFLLGRVDKVTSYSFGVRKKFGYLSAGLDYRSEQIIPQYNYSLEYGGKAWAQFDTKEAILSLRYAYAERMSPLFGRYFSDGSKYPILYSKVIFGEVENDNNKYIHALAAVKWQKHINHIGDQQYLFIAGGVFSKYPLPISKLFAGNGFQTESTSLYVFGGMQTMSPSGYYSEKFVNFYWKNDFDFKFYKLKLSQKISSSPTLSLCYNVLWGKLNNPDAHKLIQFSVPDPAYHELGIILNRVVRIKVMGVIYLNLNTGYFYHLNGPFNVQQNGRFVLGLSGDM